MSFKARMAAGTAVFGLVAGGLGMAGTMTASAATPSCGNGCISLFSQKYGPSFVVDDLYQSTATGNEQILFQDSNSDQAEDFTVMDEGTVKSHYDKYDGSQSNVSSNFEQHYKNFEVVEFKYQPSGNDSGKCLSTWPGETPQAGYKIRLEPCGAYSNSLWAVDIENAVNDHQRRGQHLLQPARAELPGGLPDRPPAAGAERPAGEHVRRRQPR